MSDRLKKILGAIEIAIVAVASVLIFINRDKLVNYEMGAAGYAGIILVCFLVNVTVFLPAPSLMVVAGLATVMNPLAVAFCGALGAAAGELAGYICGRAGKVLSPKFENFIMKLKSRVRNDSLLIFILSALPMPALDPAGMYSGASGIKVWKFFLLCFAGKFVKTMIYSKMYDILGWLYSLLGR